MTVGENIRRIRLQKGMSMLKLGDAIGCDAALIRKYECGLRNPKMDRLEQIAKALDVNVEVLANSDFDSIKAMHWLFQMFDAYRGEFHTYEAEDGKQRIGIALPALELIRSWYEIDKMYREALEQANTIKSSTERKKAIADANRAYHGWMDQYPATEISPFLLANQQKFDKVQDFMGKHPVQKTEEDGAETPEELRKAQEELKKILEYKE